MKGEFSSDFKDGRKWETILCFLFSNIFKFQDKDRKFDFYWNGTKVELKTDFNKLLNILVRQYNLEYNPSDIAEFKERRVPNFFMEKIADIEEPHLLGGPFRAAQDNIPIFVYLFPAYKALWLFNSKALVEDLNYLCAKGRCREYNVQDNNKTNLGLLTPITSFTYSVDEWKNCHGKKWKIFSSKGLMFT